MARLTPEELEENRKTSLKVLENSYIMYESSKKQMEQDAAKRLDKNGERVYTDEAIKKNLKLIETAEADVIAEYIKLGGTKEQLEELVKDKKKPILDKKHLKDLMKKETAKDEMAEYIENMRKKDIQTATNEEQFSIVDKTEEGATPVVEKPVFKTPEPQAFVQPQTIVQEPVQQVIQQPVQQPVQQIYNGNSKPMYDVINLPSKGQCYRNKKSKVKVSYLTAYDENMILSPNLYKDGTFLEYLLKAKIIDDDINVDDMVQGDRDAIVLWLRATGYGNEYPIIVTDDETGQEFETVVDLSKINYKPFKLKGDENGYFSYELPTTKDIIKFKFLSIADLALLKKLKNKESKKNNVLSIKQLCNDLVEATKDNDLISYNSQQKIKSAVEVVREEINKNYDEETDLTFSHELTDRLLLQTVSINGITDRKFIENYIFNMNIKDANSYRTYIIENEPGVDFTVEVERPQSLGGGSIKSFLRFDQFVFINY